MSCCRSQPSSARFLAAVLPALRRVKVTVKSRHVLDARQTPAPLSSHHLRGYRLGVRAKRLLLQQEPERFAFYLSGCSDTNAIKSEVPRRIRLHRIAQTYVATDEYRSCKPLIVTTNLTLEQMKNPPDLEHSRIYGRVLEHCAPILFSGKDMRKANAAATKNTARELLASKF